MMCSVCGHVAAKSTATCCLEHDMFHMIKGYWESLPKPKPRQEYLYCFKNVKS